MRIDIGPYSICGHTGLLERAGQPVHVSKAGRVALRLLAQRQGTVVRVADLEQAIWPDGRAPERGVAQVVGRLRRALRRDAPVLTILAFRRIGYQLCSNRPEPAAHAARVAARARDATCSSTLHALALAEESLRASRLDEAQRLLDAFEQATDADGSRWWCARVLVLRGMLARAKGRSSIARDHFRDAVHAVDFGQSRAADMPLARASWGAALARDGEEAAAEEQFARACADLVAASARDQAHVWLERGLQALRTGQVHIVLLAFQSLLKLSDGKFPLADALADLLRANALSTEGRAAAACAKFRASCDAVGYDPSWWHDTQWVAYARALLAAEGPGAVRSLLGELKRCPVFAQCGSLELAAREIEALARGGLDGLGPTAGAKLRGTKRPPAVTELAA